MSREIRFRSWFGIPESSLKPSMTYWDLSEYDEQSYWLIKEHSDNLMQFTGLRDKNGKEIYEGDIVNGGSYGGSVYYGIVTWSKDKWYAYPIGKFAEGVSDITGNYIEVIGNIYENKNLL